VIAAGAASRLRGLSWVSSGARYLAATLMGALALRLVLAERR
jgi:hypothetical protein